MSHWLSTQKMFVTSWKFGKSGLKKDTIAKRLKKINFWCFSKSLENMDLKKKVLGLIETFLMMENKRRCSWRWVLKVIKVLSISMSFYIDAWEESLVLKKLIRKCKLLNLKIKLEFLKWGDKITKLLRKRKQQKI